MKISLLLLLFCLLEFTPGFSQGTPETTRPHEIKEVGTYRPAHAMVVMKDIPSEYVFFRGVRQMMSFDILNFENPCFHDGKIKIATQDALIEEKGNMSFYLWSENETGILDVYLEQYGRYYLLGRTQFRTIPPDTANPDFLAAHSRFDWREPIEIPHNFNPEGYEIEEPVEFEWVKSFVVCTRFKRGKANHVKLDYVNKCNPLIELWPECKDLKIVKAPGRNEFIITADTPKEKIHLQFFTRENGIKKLVDEFDFPVMEEEKF